MDESARASPTKYAAKRARLKSPLGSLAGGGDRIERGEVRIVLEPHPAAAVRVLVEEALVRRNERVRIRFAIDVGVPDSEHREEPLAREPRELGGLVGDPRGAA